MIVGVYDITVQVCDKLYSSDGYIDIIDVIDVIDDIVI